MNYKTLIVFCLLLGAMVGTAFAATGGQASDADAINRVFNDILLVVNRSKDLIEPIVGLAVAAMIAMQAVTLRRQKASKVERAEQSAKLEHVTQQVQAVKAAVVPPQDGVG